MKLLGHFSWRRISAVAITVLAVAFVAGGCGANSTETSSTSAQTSAAGDGMVTIKDFTFGPDQITVDAGTTVVWANDDTTEHTATADDGSFDTDVIAVGKQGEATLDQSGTIPYHCDLHPLMKGEIVVK